MRNRKITIALLTIPVAVLVLALLYNYPPINDQLAWRISSWRSQIKYAFSPPEEAVFTPQEQQDQVDAILEAATLALTPSATLSATLSPTRAPASPTPTSPGPSATPLPSPTPTIASTPIPDSVRLTGIIHEYQHWNNCGPSNLSMTLSFWGWQGDQVDTEAYLKPNQRDKNVMPYEMAAYVNDETEFNVIWRVGGDLEMLKHLVAAGFPVIIEKGFEMAGFDGWMGHYEVVNGYNEAKAQFIVQDSFIGNGVDFAIAYEEMEFYWRHFNYVYIVVYPPDREAEVMSILGPQADKVYNYQHAARKASDDIFTSEGRERAFAWFNRGTNLVYLDDYAGAAAAYDEYFSIYASLTSSEKYIPWRMVWYQTGPYWAYFYTGRYYDVLGLATTTIVAASEPAIEESWYWRALAKEALGDISGAIEDLQEAVKLNEHFDIGWYHLERLQGEG